jgi:UDP-N-acetylmuramoyl-tripeptide--D-alanyl-D-alanine ligase
MLKNIVVSLLEFQARRFLKKHKPKIVAIAGSVGKTSTKVFTATVLSERYKVSVQEGSYNTQVGLPLAIFGLPAPAEQLRNPLAWLGVLRQMGRKIHQPKLEHDVLVLELGSDRPGDLERFRRYLHPDIGVITGVAAEHMANFKTIDAVAKEELSLASFSSLTMINRDEIDAIFAPLVQTNNIDTYGISGIAEYHYLVEDLKPGQGFSGKFVSPEFGEQEVTLQLLGEHNINAAVAAGAVAIKLGLTAQQVLAGMSKIKPVAGRMRLMRGMLGSSLIDDTYNSSPISAVAALQTLYRFPAKQKIAILGSMNELGDFSEEAHRTVGERCDPTLLDWVITVGDEAKRYLAPVASKRGCQVRSFKSPYDAGAFAHSVLQTGAVVLAKGSQNAVFTEEALKVLLHTTEEEKLLVRQSPDWLTIKRNLFEKIKSPEDVKPKNLPKGV